MIVALLAASLFSATLPATSDRAPVSMEHFPSREHAFVWRNWEWVSAERMASVLETSAENVARMGEAMGLGEPPLISETMGRRGYITIIRRNWHLLPYSQLTELLGMTDEELAFRLREDDFLYIKLGSLKPDCAALRYREPDAATRAREGEIAAVVRNHFPDGPLPMKVPLFDFVRELSEPLDSPVAPRDSAFSPRYCSSYFAMYGDPLMEPDLDAFPEGYAQRLVASGVDSVWMHVVLYQLAPFPWDPALSEGWETRLENLRALTERLKDYGLGLRLYLNEPRAMPLAFFESRPELKGVTEGDYAALCTSTEPVREYIRTSVQTICEAAPELAGFFTITASENLTSCWSHHQGAACPRCGERAASGVIAEVNATIQEGIDAAQSDAKLFAWDWGWQDGWATDAIAALPKDVALMSVSEWSLPIERGGVSATVGEYSISAVGPGPRATRHWAAARDAGLATLAKIQAGTTWELGAVPYIPAVENVAQHAANLREAEVDGLMLGWSLGGYPSPNLEVVAEIAAPGGLSVDAAMMRVAERRFGGEAAPSVVEAWRRCSAAFREFPYHIGVVYNAPLQVGPANPLWAEGTGYSATMVGIPYDDLDRWRGPYPADTFARQLEIVAEGFEEGAKGLRDAAGDHSAVQREADVMEAVALHYGSVANQTQFIAQRDALRNSLSTDLDAIHESRLLTLVHAEREQAKRLHAIQCRDSRIGYEATNHYFYSPMDLVEKVVNCEWLRLGEWH